MTDDQRADGALTHGSVRSEPCGGDSDIHEGDFCFIVSCSCGWRIQRGSFAAAGDARADHHRGGTPW
jgi:hypothetical protein